jgi:hypothetical protein
VQDVWQTLAFLSRKLSPSQKKYSAYDRELLAIFESVRHLRHRLEGRDYQIWTGHSPSARRRTSVHHVDFLSQFTTNIRLIPGQYNIVVDTLRRVETITAPVTHDMLAAAQEVDQELQSLLL